MGTKPVSAPHPIELTFALNPKDNTINYHCSERNGQHLKLLRRESFTFCSSSRFTIHFLEESPFGPDPNDTFLESRQRGGRWEWTSSVRDGATSKHYPYVVELLKEGHLSSVGVPGGVTVTFDPEVIIVESSQDL